MLRALLERERLRDETDREMANALTLISERLNQNRKEHEKAEAETQRLLQKLIDEQQEATRDLKKICGLISKGQKNPPWIIVMIFVLTAAILGLSGVQVVTKWGTLTPGGTQPAPQPTDELTIPAEADDALDPADLSP